MLVFTTSSFFSSVKAQFNPTKNAESVVKAESESLKFEQNIGQFSEPTLHYRAIDAQATYFFTKNEIRSVVASAKDSMQMAYALQFVGANENVDIQGIGRPRPNQGAVNYINDAGSFADVPMHNRLHYNNPWFVLSIPEPYGPYTGMCRWLLTNSEFGGDIDMAIPRYDFAISCLSDKVN